MVGPRSSRAEAARLLRVVFGKWQTAGASAWTCGLGVLLACVGAACEDPESLGGLGGWLYRPDFGEMRTILDETPVPRELDLRFEKTVGGAYGSLESTYPTVSRKYDCRVPSSTCSELASLWGEAARRDPAGTVGGVCRFEKWVPKNRSVHGEDYRLIASVRKAVDGSCRFRATIVRRPDRHDPSD